MDCTRCRGEGYIEKYRFIQNGICFRCLGSGIDPGNVFPQDAPSPSSTPSSFQVDKIAPQIVPSSPEFPSRAPSTPEPPQVDEVEELKTALARAYNEMKLQEIIGNLGYADEQRALVDDYLEQLRRRKIIFDDTDLIVLATAQFHRRPR